VRRRTGRRHRPWIKNIKATENEKLLAVAATEVAAAIIARALNYYLENETYTPIQCVEMMYRNTSKALQAIADHADKHQMKAHDLIDILRKAGDELNAQAMVVSLRDELKLKLEDSNY
jgi:hypothetical protein